MQVITASWARPNPLWLNYVITTKARTGIRSYLKHFKQQEAINLGGSPGIGRQHFAKVTIMPSVPLIIRGLSLRVSQHRKRLYC
jgi:hypothetical protein